MAQTRSLKKFRKARATHTKMSSPEQCNKREFVLFKPLEWGSYIISQIGQ